MSQQTIRGTGGVTVDLEDFHLLARDLRRASADLNKEVRVALRAVGGIVAEDAKEKAAFSDKIPSGIRVRLSGMGIAVETTTILGGLMEAGNQGQKGGDQFRHPVFGNMVNWVKQPMHPYLVPALRDKAEEVEEAVANVVGMVLDAALET
ncbi:MAG: hypothetical protein WBA31_08185 [Candidatus Dormiibacterota bacterium]